MVGVKFLVTFFHKKVSFLVNIERCPKFLEYTWKVLEAAKFFYGNKTKDSSTFEKRGSREFCHIANSVLYKGKSAVRPLFNGPVVLSSAPDKAKLVKNFSKNSNLDDSLYQLSF